LTVAVVAGASGATLTFSGEVLTPARRFFASILRRA
jgi:hypothetical protein